MGLRTVEDTLALNEPRNCMILVLVISVTPYHSSVYSLLASESQRLCLDKEHRTIDPLLCATLQIRIQRC